VLLCAAAVNVCEATMVYSGAGVDYIGCGMEFGDRFKELCSGVTCVESSCGGTLIASDVGAAH